MSARRNPAKTAARSRGPNAYWLDHATIAENDFEWLSDVERLTLWNVRIPPAFLSRLHSLWWLDIRGGSADDLHQLHGCKRLQYLAVNQIRGLRDLSELSELTTIRRLLLYGLSQVKTIPSCVSITELQFVELGQMRGLTSLRGILEAPKLQDLLLVRKVNINADDVLAIIKHPTLKRFDWFAEDVPVSTWEPVVKKIGLPPVPIEFPEQWFARHRIS